MGASRARRHSETLDLVVGRGPEFYCGTAVLEDVERGSLAPRGVGHGGPLRSFPSRRGRAWPQPARDPSMSATELTQLALGYIDIGRGEGELVTGGGRATGDGLEHGHFFEPTIFSGVRPMDRIGQEEIFGPVLSVIPVADYQEAVTALNQTRYGLSSSIYTRDVNTAFRAMRDFETGIVYVNAGTTGADAQPVRRLEGDRQRPSRGRPRRARHIHRVEGDLRRLQRPPAAGADRQPVIEPRDGRTHRSDEG